MEKTAIVQKMNEAITAGDAEQFQAAFVELCDKIQESVIEQARGIVEEADQRILSERGVRQLTSKKKNIIRNWQKHESTESETGSRKSGCGNAIYRN